MKSETPSNPSNPSSLNISFREETGPEFAVRIQNQTPQTKQAIMNTTLFPTEAAPQPHWMVVDDNKDLLLMMKMILEEVHGHAVECFDSPQAALQAFASAPDKYELVITDFEMPEINGVELCRRLRAVAHGVKVFLATGSGFFTEADAAHAGFLGLLNKPFRLEKLKAILTDAGVKTNSTAYA